MITMHNCLTPQARQIALLFKVLYAVATRLGAHVLLALSMVLAIGAANAQLVAPGTVTVDVAENAADADLIAFPDFSVTGGVGTVTYTLADDSASAAASADNDLFSIDTDSGTTSITFSASPDYEFPRGMVLTTTNTNTYNINVYAKDETMVVDQTDPTAMMLMPQMLNVALTVTVTNVVEAPTFSLSVSNATALATHTVSVDRQVVQRAGFAAFDALTLFAHRDSDATVATDSVAKTAGDAFVDPVVAATMGNANADQVIIRFASVPDVGEYDVTLQLTATSGGTDTTADITVTFTVTDSVVAGADITAPQITHMLAATARSVATTALDVIATRLTDHPRTVTTRIVDSRLGGAPDRSAAIIAANYADPLASPWDQNQRSGQTMTLNQLIGNSSFVYNLGNGRDSRQDPWSIWGEGAYRSFEGQPTGLSGYDGTTYAFHLGLDWRRAYKGVLGIAFGRSKTNLEYSEVAGNAIKREIETSLNVVYPYAQGRFSDQLTAWGVAGIGNGLLAVDHSDARIGSFSTGVKYEMFAAGARYLLNGSAKVFSFALKTEVSTAELKTDAADANSAPGSVASYFTDSLTGRADRFRSALEFSYNCRTSENVLWLSSIDFAARVDRGGADSGFGFEVSADTQYRNINSGFAFNGRANYLVSHSADQYKAWGVNFGVSVDPGANGKGASFSLENKYGDQQDNSSINSALDSSNEFLQQSDIATYGKLRTSMKIAYGLEAGRFIVSPFVEMDLKDRRDNTRIGARFKLAGESREGQLEMAIYSQSKRYLLTNETENGVFLSVSLSR